MAQRATYTAYDPEAIRKNLARIREQVAAAGARAGRRSQDIENIETLIATKYVTAAGMQPLADAGVTLVGENRAQDLLAKHERYGDRFTWDFIGHLQSNKVRQVLPLVRMIHAVDSLSVVEEIARQTSSTGVDGGADPNPPPFKQPELLLQVNIGKEPAKYGIIPSEVDRFLEEASRISQVNFSGLMTMPPLAADPEAVRPLFAALRVLASDLSQKWQGRHRFTRLSMGTSNDFQVAVEEGATIVRIGGILFAGA